LSVQSELGKFDFLKKMALELGASDAAVIPASKIVVENRVVLKCRVGCNNYGKTLTCPPYAPTAEEFRKVVGEYRYAMFMKFSSQAEADQDLAKVLAKNESEVDKGVLPRWQKFWADWKEDKKKLLTVVLQLEKAAMGKGYSMAIGLVSGMCQVCEKCNVEGGVCLHPTVRRFSEEAVGVNVHATAKNAGVSMKVPFEKKPESFALLLVE